MICALGDLHLRVSQAVPLPVSGPASSSGAARSGSYLKENEIMRTKEDRWGGGRLGNAGSKLKGGGEQEEGYLWSKRDYVPLYWKDVTGRLVGTLH